MANLLRRSDLSTETSYSAYKSTRFLFSNIRLKKKVDLQAITRAYFTITEIALINFSNIFGK